METKNKNKSKDPTLARANFIPGGVGRLRQDLSFGKAAGFTLIELLVVIAVIGLLASIVLAALASARQKARDSRRVQDINQIGKALEIFVNTNFSYPTTTGVAAGSYGILTGSAANCASGALGCVNGLIPNFIVKIPVAPTPADSAGGLNDCTRAYGGGIANDYQFGGTGVSNPTFVPNYTVTFCISQQVGSITPGVHTLTQGGIQ